MILADIATVCDSRRPLLHFLDVGGVQSPEASAIESALAGSLFDGLLASFEKGTKS